MSGLLADAGCFAESGAAEVTGEADGEEAEGDVEAHRRVLAPPHASCPDPRLDNAKHPSQVEPEFRNQERAHDPREYSESAG